MPILCKQIKISKPFQDMQSVLLNLRVLYRPKQDKLCDIYRNVGFDYDERILNSIANEVLRAVVAQYSAAQLLSQRDQVSAKIRRSLEGITILIKLTPTYTKLSIYIYTERASQFFIVIDDVSISELTFGKEYL
jgi:prohibitin 2